MRDSSVKSEGGGEGCSAPLDEPGNSVAAVFNNFLISGMSSGCECFQVVSTTGICSEDEEEEEEACDSSYSQVSGSRGTAGTGQCRVVLEGSCLRIHHPPGCTRGERRNTNSDGSSKVNNLHGRSKLLLCFYQLD